MDKRLEQGIIDIEVFSWRTTSLKDQIEVCLPRNKLLSCLHGMWSCMKICLQTLLNKFYFLVVELK